MRRTTLFLFFLFPMLCLSQVPNWQWARNMTLAFNGKTRLHDIGPDGNIVLFGDFNQSTITFGETTYTQTTPGFADVYLVKYDPLGNVVWSKKFGGTHHDGASCVKVAGDGSIYIAGGFNNNITIGDVTLTTALSANYMAKFNSDGELLWVKKASNTESGWGVQAIDLDADGNFYIAGSYNVSTLTFDDQTITFNNYLANSVMRVFFGKFDSGGNCLWLRCPNVTGQNLWGSISGSVSVDNQGRMAVTGRFHDPTIDFGGVALTKTAPYDYTSNIFVAQYDTDGTLQWAKNAGSIYENSAQGYDLAHDASGNLFATGYFSSSMSFDGIQLSAGGGSKQFLYKFSPEGTTLWGVAPQAQGSCGATGYSVDLDSSGNVYLAGMTSCSQLNFWNNVTLTMQGQGGLYVVKYNTEGQAQWARRSGEQNINNVACIKVLAPNELYVSGTFTSPTFTLGSIVLTKSASNFDMYLAKMYAQPLDADEFHRSDLTLYPNPVSSELFLDKVASGLDFSISDVSGRVVLMGKTSVSPIPVDGFESGVYVLNLSGESGNQSVKFVKN